MGKSSDSILEAMLIMVDAGIEKLKFDRTILANIVSVENMDTGEYKVLYQDAIFLAYANDITKSYSVGDLVFVTVPEGDFSNRKLILSKVTLNSLSYNEMTELLNSIVEKSPTFDILYGLGSYDPSLSYGVIAGAAQGGDEPHSIVTIYLQNSYVANNNNLFRLYAEEYEYIRIQGSFLTQLHNSFTSGNYGLGVEFWCKTSESPGYSTVYFTLDISNFNGRLYALTTYSPQSVVIKSAKGYLLGLKSIKLFEQMPGYDYWTNAKTGTVYTNITTPNIFVKDVSLQFVDHVDLSLVEYYLNINTPLGLAFTSSLSSLDLIGSLLYRGQDILKGTTCSCLWYKRDVSIMVGDDGYLGSVGAGWAPITGETSKILNLTNSDVYFIQEYKLLVIYNESIVTTAQKKIYNNTHSVDFLILYAYDNGSVYLQLTDPSLRGDWYASFSDSRYELLATASVEVDITSLLDYGTFTIHCAGYDSSNHYLGVIDYVITEQEEDNAFTITYTGQDTYRYDANGDIAVDEAEKLRLISATVTWRDGLGLPYLLHWNMKINGVMTQIPLGYSRAVDPDNSMMRKVYIDTNNKLCYYVNLRYRLELVNNTLYLYLTVSGESAQLFEKEILFLKDGDLGTNGTSYVAVIRPCDSNTGAKTLSYENMVLRYNMLNNQWVTSNLPLRCYVYKDGELITDSASYTIIYKWVATNLTLTTTLGTPIAESSVTNSMVLASGNGTIDLTNQTTLEHWVKVLIIISSGPGFNNGRPVNIYTSYPIDIVVGNMLPSYYDLSGIPLYVLYNSSGLNAQFPSRSLTWSCNNKDYPEDENPDLPSMTLISANTKLLNIRTISSSKYLEPASSFIYERNSNTDSNIGILLCNYDASSFIIRSVIMYLNNYSNAAINGWDGTSIETEDGHILAPLIGAGEKDSFNRFTGVVMGKDTGQTRIGLYGYLKGTTTFGLMEDGKAFFGAKSGGGLIVIDGTSATIYGGDASATQTAANGMIILLADTSDSDPSHAVTSATKAIRVGNDQFTVDYDGNFVALNGTLYGTICASAGKIGGTSLSPLDYDGWNITTSKIYNRNITLYSGNESDYLYDENVDDHYRLWAGSDNTHPSDAKFFVTNSGKMKATNAEISGTGNEGNGYIGLSSNGTYALWAGNLSATDAPFSVTHAGAVNASNLTVTGGSINGAAILVVREDEMAQILMTGSTFAMLAKVNGVMLNKIYFDSDKGNYVFDGILGADAIFTDSLYAKLGDIAELTVDRLSTSKRIRKYFLLDTLDENYITIQDNYIKWNTGSVISKTNILTEEEELILTELGFPITLEGGNAATELIVNRYEQPLYWQKQPVDCTPEGYPLDLDGQLIYSTTDITDWPVLAYKYKELVKSEYSFFRKGENYVPLIVLGAGDYNTRNKGYIYKDTECLMLRYVTPSNKNVDIKFGDDGFVDATHRRLSSCTINASNGTVAYTVEGSQELFYLNFTIEDNTITYIWPDGHTCVITVPGGQ